MRNTRRWIVLLAVMLAACLVSSCVKEPSPASSEESKPAESTPAEAPSGEETEDESFDLSLPQPEAIVLLYTNYLTVQAEQDGIFYEYTYCFDTEDRVFNAVAVIRFPTEKEAHREYAWLLERGYPNLQVDGKSLTFCFPRRECPFYGISYRSLELLLTEETVYEIVDSHPPEEGGGEESGASSEMQPET